MSTTSLETAPTATPSSTTRKDLWINGTWVAPKQGQYFQSINPFDQSVVGEYARATADDVDIAVKAAREAFDNDPWPTWTGEQRAAVLRQMATCIETHARELSTLEMNDAGSTLRKAKGDVHLSGKELQYFAKLAEQPFEEPLTDLSRPGVSNNVMVREPIGVCGQIIPWNFPLKMAMWKIGPALAAGNTVVLKLAEQSPASMMALVEWFHAETDLPPGVLNVITGFGAEAGEPLAKHPLVDKVGFTGSTQTGKHILQCAADTMKRVTLECGGKSANIVLDDADLTMAVDGVMFGAFFHAGQCCTAGTRVLVQRGIYDTFVSQFVEKAKRIKLGNPTDKTTDMGPLVSEVQQKRVLDYIAIGKAEGATVLCGGGTPTAPELSKGYFVAPTIFADVRPDMRIAQEEIFGPVICIIPFDTDAEAITIANNTAYGLAGGVWSQTPDRAQRIAQKLRAGTVWINEYHLTSERAPFGGYKQSGLGRELGAEGLKAYTEIKHIHTDELGDRQKKFWYDMVLAPVDSAS